MLNRWASFVFRNRRAVAALSILSLVVAVALLSAVGGTLSSSGFVDKRSESAKVAARLADQFGRGREQLVFIFDAKTPVSDPAVKSAVEAALAPVTADGRVARLMTTWSTGNPAFVSRDGASTYAVALLNVEDDKAQAAFDDLQPQVEKMAAASGMTLSTTGNPAIGKDISTKVSEGIAKAESVAIPVTMLLLLLVFGSLIAAGLPLLIGILAMVGSIAAVFMLSHGTEQSIFAVNIITLLGIALGVDYSLFMVARFREELRRRPTEEALAVTVATTGKAILFSGITVIFGLAATFFFPLPALRSMGLAGMLVVAFALVYGMTLLPATLAMLGPRINALDVRFWRRGAARRGGATEESRFWQGVAERVMQRPVAVLVPVLIALLIAGTPFLRLQLTPGGTDVLPKSAPSRAASDRLLSDFPAGESDPVPVLIFVKNRGVVSADGIAAVRSFVAKASAVAHVTRVESVVTDPALAGVDWTAAAADPASLPTAAQQALGALTTGDTTLVQVVADVDGQKLEGVVRDLRGIDPAGADVAVGGFAASSVDTIDGIKAGLLPAILFVIVGSYLILLLSFGSVFLPLKAIAMTLLSISASLGALVLVFQDGHGQGLLGFTATGQIISTTPILMFCILFGLSMDYEVLMLTRIQEEYLRTGDNRASVAFGLERTAKTITSAAAIMLVSFGAFMLADISIIKSMGFGLSLAVLIDATVVRGLLVPAAMRLMGRWNWWAPAGVKVFVDRLGLGHAETGPVSAGVVSGSAAD